MDTSGTETVGQTLENELRVLVKVGLPEARTVLLPQLFDLRCVRQEVRGDGANDSVLALEHALKEAVALLGEGDRANAARALLGLDPRTRSFKRPRRREAAKNFLLGPGYDTQTFRRRYEEALISDVAYALHKLESHVRLGFPLTRDELENLSAGPRRSEPHDGGDEGFRLIRTSGELKATLFHIVEEANECLVATGSRSRDAHYLTCIEAKLARQPDLVHYRVLFGPPRWQVLKDHLLHLLQVREASSRLADDKTMFLGVFEDYRREPENFICANEKRAFIRLPSMNGLQKYDTGIEFQGRVHASRYVRLVQEFYGASHPIESELQVEDLPVLEQDDTAPTSI